MRRAIRLAATAGAMLAAPAVAGAIPSGDTVRVVLKFVKRAGGAAMRFDPASCVTCSSVSDPDWKTDNARETVVALTVPRARTIELAFDGDPANVRRVILESGDVTFRREGRRLIVPLPPLETDAITAAEVATHIVEPGMVLRFEHADPARRAGTYASGAFPTRERRTADVLEFAQREAVRALALGRHVTAHGLGQIQIMGFDTNAPHGHRDAPPHVHMHLRWPGNTGTQISHFYIGADGLLTHNIVGVKGIDAPIRRYDRGASFATIGPDGRMAYTHRITAGGGLEIGGPDGASCLIQPVGSGGFDDGAQIDCTGKPSRIVTVEDDRRRGRMTVRIDRIEEVYRYDPDTGALLSPTAPPLPPPSMFQPPETAEDQPPLPPD